MKAGIVIVPILFLSTAYSQNAPYNSVAGPTTVSSPPLYLKDVFSTPFEAKSYAGIQGSAFLDDNWTLARVRVEGNKVIPVILIKLNIFSHHVHFRDENGDELQMALKVEEIRIIDSNSTRFNSVFLSNFLQEKGFFEVLESGGDLKLLKRHSSVKIEYTPPNSEMLRKFDSMGELYLTSDKVLYKASKSCSAIRDAYDNNEKVHRYISENSIRCNKEADLKKLVRFYGTL